MTMQIDNFDIRLCQARSAGQQSTGMGNSNALARPRGRPAPEKLARAPQTRVPDLRTNNERTMAKLADSSRAALS